MWFGFFQGLKGCVRLVFNFLLFGNEPIGWGNLIRLGYLFGGLFEFILFWALMEWAAKKNPEKTIMFLAAIYCIGALGWLSANPAVWLVYLGYLLPMYKSYQGQLYGDEFLLGDEIHEKRFQSYRCAPEVDQTEGCLIYNHQHIDKNKLLKGEVEYLSTLPRAQLKTGYDLLKKNKKLKKQAPVFQSILLKAYNSVLFKEGWIEEKVSCEQDGMSHELGKNQKKSNKTRSENCHEEEEFSWLKAVEAAERKFQDFGEELQTEDNEDDSWLSLIDRLENEQKSSSNQKVRKERKKGSARTIVGAIAVIACVAAIGVVGVLVFNRTMDKTSTASDIVSDSDMESTAEITNSAESSQLTDEDKKEIAANAVSGKAEKDVEIADSGSQNSQDKAMVSPNDKVQETSENVDVTDNAATAAETEIGEEILASPQEETAVPAETPSAQNSQEIPAATADTYLEDTYNSYAAQIQSESASLVSQMQAGTIDYMTASQQLSSLYNAGNQDMTNYWMNGNCSYADMTTWSNKLWSVYTAESPKLVGVGN